MSLKTADFGQESSIFGPFLEENRHCELDF